MSDNPEFDENKRVFVVAGNVHRTTTMKELIKSSADIIQSSNSIIIVDGVKYVRIRIKHSSVIDKMGLEGFEMVINQIKQKICKLSSNQRSYMIRVFEYAFVTEEEYIEAVKNKTSYKK